ncbi:MAG TPA: phosphatidate cytidylyltransferase [Burkholderiales bacterium]|nr:phosphatidate cytidylyltransferase [Burkholderiales bacterium]
MFRDRVITAIALIAALLAALFWLPPIGWTALAAAVLAAAAWEWAGFARAGPGGRILYATATTGAGLAAAYGSGLAEGGPGLLALAPLYGLALAFWIVGAPLWLARRPAAPSPALVLAVGWIVLLPTFLALGQLRNLGPGTLLAFMGTVWVADIAAYAVGRKFGRNKLAPHISPGKTWEGLYGALAATAVYAAAWIGLFRGATPAAVRDLPWSPVWMIVLIEALAALSVLGDLLESAMKRQAGLKDSGSLLPGHGGILDRIDALTPVLPAAALVNMV